MAKRKYVRSKSPSGRGGGGAHGRGRGGGEDDDEEDEDNDNNSSPANRTSSESETRKAVRFSLAPPTVYEIPPAETPPQTPPVHFPTMAFPGTMPGSGATPLPHNGHFPPGSSAPTTFPGQSPSSSSSSLWVGASPSSSSSPARRKWRFYDSNGRSPFGRFLLPDDPNAAYPTARVMLMMLLGFALSVLSLWLSEDEFFSGPGSMHGRAAAMNGEQDAQSSNEAVRLVRHFPVHIAFKNVGCTVPNVGVVLRNITGSIPPGSFTGIIGESGSGKTTFAYQLLGRGRRHCRPAHGTVYMNGRPRSLEAFIDRVGFVPQHDVLYAHHTVEEAITFSANWRMPRTVSEREKMLEVNRTIAVLGLERVRHSRVGLATDRERGISGGERRRVSIALELVARPSVLVLDEPTSGLDSYAAYVLVSTLADIVAKRNVTVVAVLHQPSARVFDLLERVMLLSNGSLVFAGPRAEAVPYLSMYGYEDLAPEQRRSDAEFCMDVLAGYERPAPHAKRPKTVAELADLWNHHTAKNWPIVEHEMEIAKQEELEAFSLVHKTSFNGAASARSWLFRTYAEECAADPARSVEVGCIVLNGSPFPVLPRPGLRAQFGLWFWEVYMTIPARRGVLVEAAVVFALACIVAFVRSFNMVWSRRPAANFILSIAISLVGMVGCIFGDDYGPVQRAAASGMLLAAHELAFIAYTLISGWFISHWFAVSYFTSLWLRTGVWCCKPFSFLKYYEFTHILHLHFLTASMLGGLVTEYARHDQTKSFMLAIGCIVHIHVFSLYSPNRAQVTNDSKLFFSDASFAAVPLFLARFSSVTYFLEALALWDPDRHDQVGRTFVLRYFGYAETEFNFSLTSMFALFCFGLSVRFALFAKNNTSDYNSTYDLPLFALFVLRVVVLHLCALIVMTIVQEIVLTVAEDAAAKEEGRQFGTPASPIAGPASLAASFSGGSAQFSPAQTEQRQSADHVGHGPSFVARIGSMHFESTPHRGGSPT